MKNIEKAGLCDEQGKICIIIIIDLDVRKIIIRFFFNFLDFYLTKKGVKRTNVDRTSNSKKIRMQLIREAGFKEISSLRSRIVVNFFAKNVQNIIDYKIFLASIKPDLKKLLKSTVLKNPIKFNLKLEATYHRANDEMLSENRSFKTLTRVIFIDSNIDDLMEQAFIKLLEEKEITW